MEVIEKTGDEVTTFFIDSDNSKKVERNTQNFKKDSIKNLENYKGRAETFFVDSINEQKIGGRISNNELDDLVANYKESKSDEIFSQILGQVLIRTRLLNKKNKYVQDSWTPFAESEDYEQTLSLALFMAIDKYEQKESIFVQDIVMEE